MADTKLLSAQQNDTSSLQAAVEHALYQSQLNTDNMIPAIVQSYDRDKNVAVVLPLINYVKVDGSNDKKKSLTNIPVLSLGGGGFHINFPIKADDLGWIVAADRDISLYKQQLAAQRPNTARTKTFADGMFIPDVMRKYTIRAEDADAMVIQSVDGATTISIRLDNIKIRTPVKLVIDTPLTEILQDLTVNGLTLLNGGLTASEGTAVILPANATVGTINLTTHGHEQQNDGSGRTADGMIP